VTLAPPELRAAVWQALGTVLDPELDEPITDLDFVASCTVSGDGVAADSLPRLDGHEVVVDDGIVSVETGVPTAVLHALTGWALERGVELADLTVRRPSLEDVYLALTEEDPT